ncbi:hypothetical protein [Rhodococcus sp. SGAir0479]|uniref:hypothetical protein n=1 Tax=Rhodococcus sp. SGAir0479 TaxID=2567884 RepID=UPI0010CD4E41|nr:hypothetical protein [Rhodococcus sp. SGAir0479]QCQ91383.1 hypothetical protein E7742_09115 [Rhodococcus sp. SGAir0479]
MSNESLPLPDYDQLSTSDVQHRVRSLDLGQVQQLLEHERANAHRPHIVEILSARIAALESGATPSAGDPRNAPPVSGTAGSSAANPAQAAEGSTPLRHGVARQTPDRGKP